jgi:peptidoglycan/LPS O-acetylase OafA/YrhL
MSAPVPADRYHALDSLRGFAMFLGIVLHAALSFMVGPPAFWPVRDNDPTPLADVCLIAIHDFRMQLFFLLAGFFGCLLYQRYGLGGLTKHRLKRVAVPLVLSLLLVIPTVQAVCLYAEVENVRLGARGEPSPLRPFAAELVAANPDADSARITADFFLSGNAFVRLQLLHLWFLYYLLIFVAVVAALAPLLNRLSGTKFLARFDAGFRRVVEGRGRVPVPALLTFPLMLPMNWIVDTQAGWMPKWHIVGYYFAFFGFGWLLYRHRDLVPAFGRGWRTNLALANLVVLPVMIGVIVTGRGHEKAGADALGWQLGGFAASALYTWLMIAGLWGAFLRLFARESAWARYMADSAYWCYLASLTPILAFQFAVKDWPLPGLVKCALVTAATMAALLASYEWCVRYTLIGAVLNGRKYRAREERRPTPGTAAKVAVPA